MIIAILGPDGSGKSTIADMIVVELEQHGFNAHHHPFRFGILPTLSTLRFDPERPSERKHDQQNRGASLLLGETAYDLSENPPLRTFVYMIWYGTDYLLGGLGLRLRNMFCRRKRVAVFARYFYDYYYQSNNRRLPAYVKRVIEILVPRPRFIFFLDRDAQDIHDGKPELPVEEIRKQQQIIRSRMNRYTQFHVIDARVGAVVTTQVILDHILDKIWH